MAGACAVALDVAHTATMVGDWTPTMVGA